MINDIELIISLLSIKRYGKKTVVKFILDNCMDLDNCINSIDTFFTDEEKEQYKQGLIKAKLIEQTCSKNNIKIITMFDERFPNKLYKDKDPVVLLYYYGDISLLFQKCVTIIGTREPDQRFLNESEEMIKEISKSGYVVVSGLAIGCDAFAHKTCLDVGGKTIAILPSSINDIQPRQNIELARRIAKSGSLLISEYQPGYQCTRYSFPERDRIQCILADTVFVIQSTNSGGTMICVRKAIQTNKPVFALEGNSIDLIKNYISIEDISKAFPK